MIEITSAIKIITRPGFRNYLGNIRCSDSLLVVEPLWESLRLIAVLISKLPGIFLGNKKFEIFWELKVGIFWEMNKIFWSNRTTTDTLITGQNYQLHHNTPTVNFLNIRTPKTFVVITLKFELCGSIIESWVQTMQTEWQTVQTQIRLLLSSRSSLIWVCIVCPGISVRKLRIITVCAIYPTSENLL